MGRAGELPLRAKGPSTSRLSHKQSIEDGHSLRLSHTRICGRWGRGMQRKINSFWAAVFTFAFMLSLASSDAGHAQTRSTQCYAGYYDPDKQGRVRVMSKVFESSERGSYSAANTDCDSCGVPSTNNESEQLDKFAGSNAEQFSNVFHSSHPNVVFNGYVICATYDSRSSNTPDNIVTLDWPPAPQQTAQARPPASTARGVIKKAVNECLILRNQQEIGLAPNAALYNRCAFPVMASFCYQKAGSLFACGPPMKVGLNNFAPGGWLPLELYPTGAAVHWTACQGGLEDPDASPNLQWKGGVLRSSCGVSAGRPPPPPRQVESTPPPQQPGGINCADPDIARGSSVCICQTDPSNAICGGPPRNDDN